MSDKDKETTPEVEKGQPQKGSNDPEKAMNSPEDVEKSKDEKTDEDFPGYPHYPAKEDILDPESGFEKADLDVENLSRSHQQRNV